MNKFICIIALLSSQISFGQERFDTSVKTLEDGEFTLQARLVYPKHIEFE